jgi:hypothetical protein
MRASMAAARCATVPELPVALRVWPCAGLAVLGSAAGDLADNRFSILILRNNRESMGKGTPTRDPTRGTGQRYSLTRAALLVAGTN